MIKNKKKKQKTIRTYVENVRLREQFYVTKLKLRRKRRAASMLKRIDNRQLQKSNAVFSTHPLEHVLATSFLHPASSLY